MYYFTGNFSIKDVSKIFNNGEISQDDELLTTLINGSFVVCTPFKSVDEALNKEDCDKF